MVGRPVQRVTHEIQNGEDIEFEVRAGQREMVPRLSVKNLSSPGKFEDISFDVNPGEIVGMGGLLGAGRSEVARAIFIVAGGDGIDLSIGATLAPAAIVGAKMAPYGPAGVVAGALLTGLFVGVKRLNFRPALTG